MAQHQINIIGPEGPVFTEGLRNYEIVRDDNVLETIADKNSAIMSSKFYRWFL